MKLEMLKAKLFQARVTDANVEYEGSFGIDTELMEAVGLHPYEKVLISNINNGHRLETSGGLSRDPTWPCPTHNPLFDHRRDYITFSARILPQKRGFGTISEARQS